MATTPNGLPYPVGTDKVVDGDDAIKALALFLDPSYGPWTPYTPAFTNLTATLVAARYQLRGKLAVVQGLATLTAVPTTTGYVSLPAGAIPSNTFYPTLAPLGSAAFIDTSANLVFNGLLSRSGSNARFHVGATGGSISSTSPFAWAVGDQVAWQLLYEVP